jgi:hypothetical protein
MTSQYHEDYMNQKTLVLNESNTTGVKCAKCGSELFRQVTFIRDVSPLLTQSGKKEQVFVPAFQCIKCQTVVGFGSENEKKQPKSVKILQAAGDFLVKIAPFLTRFLRK